MRPFLICLALGGLAQAQQIEPVLPENTLDTFQIDDSLRIELIACEPAVVDPVALAFDHQGRLFVVEDNGYPTQTDPPLGRVVLLTDADADGQFETRTVFAEGFDFPNGLMPWRDGWLVTCAPDLIYLKDTDGDNRADVRDVVLTGFALGGSTQLRVSHPTLGLDNWIYLTNGLSGGKVTSRQFPDQAVVEMGGADLRYNPFNGSMESVAGQAQFGQTFDDHGNRFVCSNRKHIQHSVMDPRWLARNPLLGPMNTVADIPEHGEAARIYPISDNVTTAYSHIGTFTAACGICVYRGDALPAEYKGNSFTCDPTGNLVHRDVLTPDGPTFVARRAQDKKEFLASKDNWFRPVFTANGPDGALYICDMYRFTIEHPTYLPKEAAAKIDFFVGNDRGRIYRISAKTAPVAAKALANQANGDRTTAGLAAALASQNSWKRETAHRLLLESNDPSKTDVVRALALEATMPLARLHALRLLQGFGAISEDDILVALNDTDPRVRDHAVQIATETDRISGAVVESIRKLANDDDAAVRFRCAIALGRVNDAEDAQRLASIVLRDIGNEWTRLAVLGAAHGNLAAMASHLLAANPPDSEGLAALLQPLARMIAEAEMPPVAVTTLRQVTDPARGFSLGTVVAGASGAAEGAAQNESYPEAPYPLARIAAAASDPIFDLLIQKCLDIAVDTKAAAKDRIAALHLLGYAGFDTAGERIVSLLGAGTDQEISIAAVQALSAIADVRVAPSLLNPDTWAACAPPVRTAALNAVLSRGDRVPALLDAIEAGVVQPNMVPPTSRQALLKHTDPAIQKRADVLFGTLQAVSRESVFNDYKSILTMEGSTKPGRLVYLNVCAQCHKFQGMGYEVGPDLSDVRLKPAETILLHIIDPNREVTAGYEQVVVETETGEMYSGVMSASTDTAVTIRQALGVNVTVKRSDIHSITTASLSLMPEQLEANISKQELRDLLAFLIDED
ncbi:MAG: hypothetical protein AMXMBFR84_41200 [Candidatus Hydrogenedentota bacterium]